MKDFLKSPIGITSLLIAAVTGLIAIGAWFFPVNAQKSDLSIAIIPSAQLIPDASLSKTDSLAFLYNGQTVSNLVSTKFRLENTGTEPIQESDFIESLKVIFPSDTNIIDYKLTQVQPSRDASLFQQSFIEKVSDFSLTFKPVLINPDEIFDIDIITTRARGSDHSLAYEENEIMLEYRIRGISQVVRVSDIKTNLEKRNEARDLVSTMLNDVLGPVAIGVLIMIILSLVAPEVAKIFPKKKVGADVETNKTRQKIFVILFFGAIALLLAYLILRVIYNAWFLPV